MILGIFTGVLLVMYLGIVAWAYSGRRGADFAAAAQLPLIEGDSSSEPHP
jgi:cytochrome c oxidase cbb3-type subunit 4